ncbi:type II secretion system protein GspE [Blautia pseudococcoides]|uniref:Type II secretion system protein GspE n=1 Tax=Blautia pseudococcoides TaxID=1796616 RepID=A0A1C7IK56_9FIRM|nr:type II secretion system protein GspE [Blautia pseudococcoides]ASU31830.1 type II secretion system protein GspE [Blautia pseudococcoides]QQQ95523.1 Flp pilus assembly complex ATPase component TadA [Blautia pseudococcoides]
MRNVRIGDVLKEYGYVTEEQISAALAYQKEHKGVRLGAALTDMGFISEEQLLEALSTLLQVRIIDISTIEVDVEAVQKIPRQLAEKYEMLAVKQAEGVLTIVLYDPLNFYAIEDIRQLTGMQLEICLSGRSSLKNAIGYYYSEVEARKAASVANEQFEDLALTDEFNIDEEGDDDTPIINLLSRLIDRAYNTNASDIHIEPFEDKTTVRMRIDGVIVEFVTLQKNLHASLIARIKILGNMDIAERRVPQDGHFRMRVAGEYVNIRVSVIPTVFGEKAVLRLLANNSNIDYPETFGMHEGDYKKLKSMLGSPNGIIYFTGPTGSGKTTTLYMILTGLSKRAVNISTIEDPVEKNLPKINQMQVNNQSGLTFEIGLRALLRQDPDIIMVGETRDVETASISVRSAITGHLVFSTLHTNDASSSIIRLEDMGLQPYMVANSLVGIIAQRLMRKICPDCGEETAPTAEERQVVGPDIKKIMHPKGCPQCNYTGYRGRIAIHEVLLIDRTVRKMIMEGASAEAIQDYAVEKQNMKTLKDAGLSMVQEGVTSVEELKKVAYYK